MRLVRHAASLTTGSASYPRLLPPPQALPAHSGGLRDSAFLIPAKVARACAFMRIMATCQLSAARSTYMPPDREKFPLPERIFLAFNAVTRWAASGSVTRPDSPGSRRGCANPFALLKVLIFLVMILLFPLFVLPMMLVRLAGAGRRSFRYGSLVDIAAGEEARWGHGSLGPVPGGGVIGAGPRRLA